MVNDLGALLKQNPYTCSKLLIACKYLKTPEYRSKRQGLCENVNLLLARHFKDVYFSDALLVLHAIWEQWSKYSGSLRFPVPPPHGFSHNLDSTAAAARYVYRMCEGGDFYVGEYGALRLELLDFTIQTLEGVTL